MYKFSQKSKNRDALSRMHKDRTTHPAFLARKMWLSHTSFNKKQMGQNWLPERNERYTECYNYELWINKGKEKNILKQKAVSYSPE